MNMNPALQQDHQQDTTAIKTEASFNPISEKGGKSDPGQIFHLAMFFL